TVPLGRSQRILSTSSSVSLIVGRRSATVGLLCECVVSDKLSDLSYYTVSESVKRQSLKRRGQRLTRAFRAGRRRCTTYHEPCRSIGGSPMRLILTLWIALLTLSVAHAADDVLIADFEGETYKDWKTTGTAFGTGPARGTLA